MTVRRTARPMASVLAAAVLAGGMALTGATPALAAAPAETADGAQLGWFSRTEPNGRFHTLHAVKDVRVTVAPFTFTDGPEWPFLGEQGPETGVQVTYDAELEHGAVDFVAQRRVLGEEGVGPVVFTLYVDGKPTSSTYFGADENLGDDVPGERLATYGPQEYVFPMRATVDHRTLLAAPGSRLIQLPVVVDKPADASYPESIAVVEGPQHGRLVSLPQEGDPTHVGHGLWASTVYVADEGFTGKDQAVFTITDDSTGKSKTLVVTLSVGDPRAADPAVGVIGTGLPYDKSRVWDALKDAPSAPASSAVPAAPASSAPASAPAAQSGEHAVPGTVQTGEAQAWWLAGLSALGLGGLGLAARRRAAR